MSQKNTWIEIECLDNGNYRIKAKSGKCSSGSLEALLKHDITYKELRKLTDKALKIGKIN